MASVNDKSSRSLKSRLFSRENSLRLSGLLLFSVFFVVGLVGINASPLDVKVTRNQTTLASDGIDVSFNVYEPVGVLGRAAPEEKYGVLIGHGFTANKEIMEGIAIELARAGFVAVTFDFQGHGLTTGYLGDGGDAGLVNDIMAVKGYLIERTDVVRNQYGIIGYSMGGGAAFDACAQDPAFQAMVGVAPSPREVNATNPPNLLIVVGKYDEAFYYPNYRELVANRTGLAEDAVEYCKTYGAFAAGTATRLEVKSNVDHLTVVWDAQVQQDIADWMSAVFPVDGARSVITNQRLTLTIIGLIGGLGTMFLIIQPVARVLLGKPSQKSRVPGTDLDLVIPETNPWYQEAWPDGSPLPRKSQGNLIKRYFLYSLLFAVPGVILFAPTFLLPPAFAGLLLMLLGGNFLAVVWLLRVESKRGDLSIRGLLKDTFHVRWQHYVLGIMIAIPIYLVLYLFVGQHYLGIAPGITRWPYLPLVVLLAIVPLAFDGLYFFGWMAGGSGGSLKETAKLGSIYFLLKGSFMTIVILVPCIIMWNFFFAIFIIVAIWPVLLVSYLTAVLSRHSGVWLAASVAAAIIMATFVTAITPMMFILERGLF